MSFFRRRRRIEQKQQPSKPVTLKSPQSLDEVQQWINKYFGEPSDMIFRNVGIGNDNKYKGLLVFIQDITNQDYISEQIIKPLKSFSQPADGTSPIDYLKDTILSTGDILVSSDFTTLFDDLLMGKALLFIEGQKQAFSIAVDDWKGRQVEQPSAQTVVRGPRESFTENINTNKALIRKRIRSQDLQIKSRRLGKYTQTEISIIYLKGVADDDVVKEVEKRIDKIQLDGISGSNQIEELIQDGKFSPFPTIDNTERPDITAASLLEGKVIILVNGTPFVLIAPVVFMHFFQTAEDYYARFYLASAIRFLRVLSVMITLLAPSIYIALTTFHQEMLPTRLLTNLAAQREGVPFPAFVEAVMMEVTFEILREAGIRMPRAVGQAVSVVGAIVIGQAAVEAGIVSAAMVIVVSITAISSFVIPSYSIANSIRLLRFPMMIFAGSFGFFGVMLALFALTIHLCSLKSFGISYMAPLSPFHLRDQRDTFIRTIKSYFSSKGETLEKSRK
ncbi:spore germination protein KA [Cerasibacillus quisquiliarum]|uniref:Spore germination protein KA n=1 Tax=Cerasibacillus quisquiliarum TaxID=227865 RepID=A0A511UYE5_9BACI|nr:spore germination protein [Cerasibacillus quisquiliarum]MBB5146849.1 spore germination protein KA [Cerasibacillus quisquiliarum]GEN31656.1 spore germination protein KA [Cerasibacillus quisquiliarum]